MMTVVSGFSKEVSMTINMAASTSKYDPVSEIHLTKASIS